MSKFFFAPDRFNVDAFLPLQRSVNIHAPASPVDAPSLAPFQSNVEDNETFASARPVDAHSAPLYSSVDANNCSTYLLC